VYEEKHMAEFLSDGKLFYLGPTKDSTGRISKEFKADMWEEWRGLPNLYEIDLINHPQVVRWTENRVPYYALRRETWTTLRFSFQSGIGVKARAREAYQSVINDLSRKIREIALAKPDNTYFVEGPDLYMRRDAFYYEMYGWLHLFELNPQAA
jgi:hypothetical protein